MRKQTGANLFPILSRQFGDDRQWRACQVIICSECRSEAHLNGGARLPEPIAAKKFEQQGWLVDGRGHHYCPACLGTKRKWRKDEMISNGKAQASAPPPERTPAAREKLGELYMMLSEAYQGATQTYAAGWSDERIAKETGLALEFVAARRESDFGPLTKRDTTFEDIAKATKVILGSVTSAREEQMRTHAAIIQRLNDIEISAKAVAVAALKAAQSAK